MTKLTRFLKSDKLSFSFRLLIGAMILYAEVPKLTDINKYSVQSLYSYHVFPMEVVRILGNMGPYIGILIGLGLIFGVLTRLSATGWLMMCLLFIGMKIDVIFVQGRIAPCGCFPGVLSNLKMNQSIWIDIAAVPMMIQVILANPQRKFLAAWSFLPEPLRNSWLQAIW